MAMANGQWPWSVATMAMANGQDFWPELMQNGWGWSEVVVLGYWLRILTQVVQPKMAILGAMAIPMALAGASPATLFDAQLAQVPTPAVNGVDFDGRWLYFRVADDIDNFLCVDTQDMAT